MGRLFLIILCMVGAAAPAWAEGPWAGQWQVTWQNGGAVLSLDQQGTAVTGSYSNGRGKIQAAAKGGQLSGQIDYDGAAEGLTATLGEDGKSFSAQTDAGDWLSGIRQDAATAAAAAPMTVDLHNPRATMRSFLDAANRADGNTAHALAWAVDTIDFTEVSDWSSRETRFSAAEQLFRLIDQATFSLSAIPDKVSEPRVSISLPRLEASAPVTIEMARDHDGNWRIVMPSAEALRRMAGSAAARPADGFRQLQSPRDTLRAFLEGMARWGQGGTEQAISAIDLSFVPDVLKSDEGRLIAQYLVHIIDRVGQNVIQSVPNSGASREPFIYYENPAGRIVIEPVGTGTDTRWKFSDETAQGARRLFSAVESLPERHTLESRLIPYSLMFAMREKVKAYAPILLKPALGYGQIEYWQALTALTLLAAMIMLTLILRRALLWLLTRPAARSHVKNPDRLAGALGLGLAFAIGTYYVRQIGLPAATRQYTVPVVGSVLLLIVAYAVWQIIAITASILEQYAERTETTVDNILLTFVAGVARLTLVALTALALGHLWSLPSTGLLAGLGISGLAVAFASKETLANVFGAGILLGDRPFRKGDRIIAGDVNGWVEAVGIRSTRIRTLHDSLLVVPNGKLADMTINNLGVRRRRTLSTTLLVTGGSTPESLQAFTEAVTKRIAADPLFLAPATEVGIAGIVAGGIQIEISTILDTRSGTATREATHRLYIDILRLAEDHGLTLGRGTEKQRAFWLQET